MVYSKFRNAELNSSEASSPVHVISDKFISALQMTCIGRRNLFARAGVNEWQSPLLLGSTLTAGL